MKRHGPIHDRFHKQPPKIKAISNSPSYFYHIPRKMIDESPKKEPYRCSNPWSMLMNDVGISLPIIKGPPEAKPNSIIPKQKPIEIVKTIEVVKTEVVAPEPVVGSREWRKKQFLKDSKFV